MSFHDFLNLLNPLNLPKSWFTQLLHRITERWSEWHNRGQIAAQKMVPKPFLIIKNTYPDCIWGLIFIVKTRKVHSVVFRIPPKIRSKIFLNKSCAQRLAGWENNFKFVGSYWILVHKGCETVQKLWWCVWINYCQQKKFWLHFPPIYSLTDLGITFR